VLSLEIADTSVWARKDELPEFGMRFIAGLVGVTTRITTSSLL
jgi:hypothetical protein